MLWSLADAMEDELRGPRRLRLFGREESFDKFSRLSWSGAQSQAR